MSRFKRPFNNADLAQSPPFQGDTRTKLHEDIDVRGKPSRYGEEEFPDGLDDPVGFQRQLFQQQLRALSSSSGGCSRKINTAPINSISRSTHGHIPATGIKGARGMPHLGTEASYDFMENEQAEDASETDGALPAPRPFFGEEQLQHQQSPQQIVVFVPYPVGHVQDTPRVKPFTRLTPEKIFFAIPPVILFVVLAVGLLRVLQKAANTRAKFSKRRVDSRRYGGRYRRRERSFSDTSSEAEDFEFDSNSSLRLRRRKKGRRNYRRQGKKVEQLAYLLRRRAAKNGTAARGAAAAKAAEFKNQPPAVLEPKSVHVSETHADALSEAPQRPSRALQTRGEEAAEPLKKTPLHIRRKGKSATTTSVPGHKEVSDSLQRKHAPPQKKTVKSDPAPVVVPTYAAVPPATRRSDAVAAAKTR